jgi:hypothetical protein
MACPHPARSFGSGPPLPSLGEGLGVRAQSMLHTLIQQCQDSLGATSNRSTPIFSGDSALGSGLS